MGLRPQQPRRRTLRRRLCVRALAACLTWLGAAPAVAQTIAPPPRVGVPPPARGYRISDQGALTVEHMAVSEAAAARLAAIYTRSAQAVESSLGLQVPTRPHAILAPTDSQFLRRFQDVAGYPAPGLVLAVAFPRKNVILVRESGIEEGTHSSLEVTLRHELVHLVLGPVEQRRGQRLPKWLNEGLSEWASGRRLTPQEENQVAGWARAGQLPLLDHLEGSFPSLDHGMARAYTISLAYLSWLEARHGEGTLRALVAQLEAGAPLPQALEQATGAETAVDLEPEWHASLAQDHSFWEGLIYGLDVWAVTALLALLAIARHVLRNRRLKREMALAELAEDERRAARAAREARGGELLPPSLSPPSPLEPEAPDAQEGS